MSLLHYPFYDPTPEWYLCLSFDDLIVGNLHNTEECEIIITCLGLYDDEITMGPYYQSLLLILNVNEMPLSKKNKLMFRCQHLHRNAIKNYNNVGGDAIDNIRRKIGSKKRTCGLIPREVLVLIMQRWLPHSPGWPFAIMSLLLLNGELYITAVFVRRISMTD